MIVPRPIIHWPRRLTRLLSAGASLAGLLLVGCALADPTATLVQERPTSVLATAVVPAPSPSPPGSTPATPVPPATALPSTPTPRPTRAAQGVTASPSPTVALEPYLESELRIASLETASHGPADVTVLADRVYIAMHGSDAVTMVTDGAVERVISVGREPASLCSSADLGRVFVAVQRDEIIAVIENDQIIARWPVPARPTAIEIIEGLLWIGTANGDILRLSPLDGTIQTKTELSRASAVQQLRASQQLRAAPDRLVYALTYGSLHVIDSTTLRETAALEIPSYRTLGVAPLGDRVYLCGYDPQMDQSLLQVLDATTLQILKRVPVPADPNDLEIDPRSGDIYLLSSSRGLLTALDGDTLEIKSQLPVGEMPRGLALDPDNERLLVPTYADSLVIVDLGQSDTPGPMKVRDVIPLSLDISALAVDADTDTLFAACGSCDRIYVLANGALQQVWRVGRHPTEIALLPGTDLLAVLCQAENRLYLLDTRDGHVVSALDTNQHPRGLAVDVIAKRLYAGDRVFSWDGTLLRTLAIPTIYRTTVPPNAVIGDTRRDLWYAVAFNGVPGSNGGYVVRSLQESEQRGGVPGRLSVIDIVYDHRRDRFYTTNGRMGTFGLQVTQARDNQEMLYLPLDRQPRAMVLNPATGHLWIALADSGADEVPRTSTIVGCDTRGMQVIASFEVNGRVETMAVDASRARVYLGTSDRGLLHVLQDRAAPLPAGSRALPTLPPRPTITLAPTPRCSLEPAAPFAAAYKASGQQALGCALLPAERGDWAVQRFQRGWMYWQGASSTIYVLFDDRSYQVFGDEWREGMAEISCEATPPADTRAPVRGFGRVWCLERAVKDRIGWALDAEESFVASHQVFANGLLLTNPAGGVLTLLSSGEWQQTEG